MSIGFFFGKRKMIDRSQTKILSVLCVYLFLPSTIFNSFSHNFTIANIQQYTPLLLGSFAILLTICIITWLMSGLMTDNAYERRILFYTLTAPNYGYVGYAVMEGLFGAEGLLYLILFSIPISLFTYTLGFSMLTKRPLSLKKLLNPVLCAVLLGIFVGLMNIELPNVANMILNKAAGAMAPVSMLLAGLTISEFDFKSLIPSRNTIITCVCRLLIIPGTILFVLRLLTDNTQLIQTAALCYAMPCGMNTIVFPKLVGEDCKTGAQLAFLSNLAAALTIPLFASLL